jgi:hypothetical protein
MLMLHCRPSGMNLRPSFVLMMLLLSAVLAVSCGGGDDDEGGGFLDRDRSEDTERGDAEGGPEPQPAQQDRGDLSVEWQPTGSELQEVLAGALQDQQVFEMLAEALNQTLKFPADVPIAHLTCGEENAYYDPDQRAMLLCYELLEKIATLAAESTTDEEELGTRIVGTWLFIFFHELGHGLIDLYDLPITGREEDAVDDFSTVLLIEAGLAEFALTAAEYWAISDTGMYDELSYADEHSLNPQRFFSILCTVYGSDPNAFEEIVSGGYLPESRAQRCQAEYEQKLKSWDQLLAPWAK